jgi:hypothetical protein
MRSVGVSNVPAAATAFCAPSAATISTGEMPSVASFAREVDEHLLLLLADEADLAMPSTRAAGAHLVAET